MILLETCFEIATKDKIPTSEFIVLTPTHLADDKWIVNILHQLWQQVNSNCAKLVSVEVARDCSRTLPIVDKYWLRHSDKLVPPKHRAHCLGDSKLGHHPINSERRRRYKPFCLRRRTSFSNKTFLPNSKVTHRLVQLYLVFHSLTSTHPWVVYQCEHLHLVYLPRNQANSDVSHATALTKK